MELNCLFDADHGLLRATLHGHFSLPDAQTTFNKTLEDVLRYRAKRVLIDGRAITGEPKTLERFYYGEFVADAVEELGVLGLAHIPPFAYVLIAPVLDKHRFGKTVAANRGMNVNTFDNLHEAELWLGLHGADLRSSIAVTRPTKM